MTGLVTGCGALTNQGPPAASGSLAESVDLSGQSYTVGGKEFDEQLVLCQILVADLESVGAQVTDRCGLGGTEVTRNALLGGDIDMYWEYTGTAWVTFLQETPIPDSAEQYRAVRDRDLADNQVVWLQPTPFSNTYAFAVQQGQADQLGLRTLSDMAAYIRSGQPGKVCVQTEYQNRDDGLQGLQRAYDFQIPPDQLEVLQTGVIYQATADQGGCLFGLVFTTDGRIPQLGLTVLTDDKNYHPKYNAAVTVRKEVYDRNPDLAQAIQPVATALTEEVMTELNRQKSVAGRSERDIAREWLAQQGFIG